MSQAGAVLHGWLYVYESDATKREELMKLYTARLKMGSIARHRIEYVNVSRAVARGEIGMYRLDLVIAERPGDSGVIGFYTLNEAESVVLQIFAYELNVSTGAQYWRKTGAEKLGDFEIFKWQRTEGHHPCAGCGVVNN